MRKLWIGCLCLAGCVGEIGEPVVLGGSDAPARADDPAAGPSRPAAPSGAPTPTSGPITIAPGTGLHRLNNVEYDNTVRDLLGVASSPARSFIADEKAFGFDNNADALGMTDAQYEQYFNAADSLVEQTFADASLRGKLLSCTPSGPSDLACMRRVIEGFGQRAWRRPLETSELDRLQKVAQDASALGEDANGALKQALKALLVAVPFLYRVEAGSSATARVGPFELASRLSYLVWSTQPDARLLELAGSGALTSDATLSSELKRMLADPKGDQLVHQFAGQWLGLRDLAVHQVEPEVFPSWNDALRGSMIAEGERYFDDFLRHERSLSEFFSAGGGARPGFLGLASFLTVTSFSYRTAPTLRGKWVLESLLCQDIPPPPPNIPQLEPEMGDPAQAQLLNVRERLAEHRKNPECAACHKLLDPIGLGLENFDAIGRFRDEYANGDAVDASGMLPDGSVFDGLPELSALLAPDARLPDCALQKLLTYALSRQLQDSDTAYRAQLLEKWQSGKPSLRALLELIVLGEPFRSKAG